MRVPGSGVEKALHGEDAGRIARETILPRCRAKRMADGIRAGSEAIIREITT